MTLMSWLFGDPKGKAAADNASAELHEAIKESRETLDQHKRVVEETKRANSLLKTAADALTAARRCNGDDHSCPD